jgi:hypothetical protein
MRGKIFISLFALPFFGVGVWMLWSISSSLVESWQMDDWVQAEARLTRGGYETRSGDDSNTYEAYADYVYDFQGRSYSGSRVSLSSGADNIGDYQTDIGRRLQSASASGDYILIYVNPDNPAESIIDRGVRWGLMGFKSIFLFVFGGVGLGLLIFTWRAPKEKDQTLPKFQDAPWLLNDDWQTATIRSSSKSSMYGAWIFAAFWNLISAPLPFVLYGEILEKQNYVAIVGLLFPIVGIGLLVWAVRRTKEWTRFGAAPVTLDPFPGSIGGHVGGTIDLKLRYDSSHEFELSLTNIHSYVSGSGKNRSQREKALWQDSTIAHAEVSAKGTRLTFRFDIPEGFNESDTEQDDSYHIWRLSEGHPIFGSVFGGMGSLIALACLYMMLNSLQVIVASGKITTVRRLLGFPISRKSMHRNVFASLGKNSNFKTQSGSKHIMYYSVHAIDREGNKLVVGEGFKGESEANAAIELMSSQFGLHDNSAHHSNHANGGNYGAELLS